MCILVFERRTFPESSPYIQTVVCDTHHINYEGQHLLIQDADEKQFTDYETKNSPNTTYDLRVGEHYWDISINTPTSLGNQPICIKPNMFVGIQTQEQLTFPRGMSGALASKTSLLQKGIGVFASNVDPGYTGHLWIYVHNLGSKDVELKKGDYICALKISSVKGHANLYTKGEKFPGRSVTGPMIKIKDFVYRNSKIIPIYISFMMLILSILIYFKK